MKAKLRTAKSISQSGINAICGSTFTTTCTLVRPLSSGVRSTPDGGWNVVLTESSTTPCSPSLVRSFIITPIWGLASSMQSIPSQWKKQYRFEKGHGTLKFR